MLRWSSLAIFSFNIILRGKKKILPQTIPWCILLVLLHFVFHILLFNSLASYVQSACGNCVFPVLFGVGKSPCVLCCAYTHSHGWLFVTPQTVVHQAPLSMEFFSQEYWSALPFPPPWHLSDPAGIKPRSPVFPALQVDSLPTEPLGKPCLCKWHNEMLLFLRSHFSFLLFLSVSPALSSRPLPQQKLREPFGLYLL